MRSAMQQREPRRTASRNCPPSWSAAACSPGPPPPRMPPLQPDAIRLRRAHAQHLLGNRLSDAAAVVRAVAGVQAQDRIAGMLSIRVRSSGLTRTDVERALVEERSIVRLWAMRGTIHLVPSEDAAWLVDLLGPLAIPGSMRRLAQLGVPPQAVPHAIDLIRDTLAEHGPLTRAELMEPLGRAGITTEGQAAAHLPGIAALRGLVVNGPNRGGKPTYVLRDDWLGHDLPRLARDDAVEELVRRYLRAFGPAEPEDFARWSGLPLRDARAGWAATGGAAGAGGTDAVEQPAPAEPTARDAPSVRLLPAFDTYLLGYRSRDFCVDPANARAVWPGGGIVRPTVVVDGHCAGTWRRSGADAEIEPFPGERFDAAAEVEDVRRFLRG